jgi:hypothetical protein
MVMMYESFPDWIRGYVFPRHEGLKNIFRKKNKTTKNQCNPATVRKMKKIKKENKRLKKATQSNEAVALQRVKDACEDATFQVKTKLETCERERQNLRDQHRDAMDALRESENERRRLLALQHRNDLIDMRVDLLNGTGSGKESFAVKFTNPNPDLENKVMSDLYDTVMKGGIDWSDNPDYQTMTKNDYDDFYADVSGAFYKKHAEIQRDIDTLEFHVRQYGSTAPVNRWLEDNSGNVTRTVQDMSKEAETNQRRTEYESQVVDSYQIWRYVVTAIFAIAVCVYVYYEGMELVRYFSWGRLWMMTWRVLLMGGYLYSIEYVVYSVWTLFRMAVQYVRDLLQL